MLASPRSGASLPPLPVLVGAQKLASGPTPCGRGDNVRPVSSLAAESPWVHCDLDYMHARFCSPITGRFLSVDPAMESADPFTPQTWNRYNYVAGNPLKYIDPTGEILFFIGSNANLDKVKQVVNDTLNGVDLVIGKDGKAALVPNQEVGPPSPEQQAFADTLSKAINEPGTVNLGVVAGASDVIFGNFATGQLDIADIQAAGSGVAVNSAALFAHEVAEQTAKQTLGANFAAAHAAGLAAQQGVSGFTRGLQHQVFDGDLIGATSAMHTRGNRTVTVTIQFVRGNLVRIDRQ